MVTTAIHLISKKQFCTCSTLFSNWPKKKNNSARANFTRIFKVFPKFLESRGHLRLLVYHYKGQKLRLFDICGGIERTSSHGHRRARMSVAKCRGSWVVDRGRGSWVWVVGVGVGNCRE